MYHSIDEVGSNARYFLTESKLKIFKTNPNIYLILSSWRLLRH
jgi:hypothetical protein